MRYSKTSTRLFKALSRKHGESPQSVYIAESDEYKVDYACEHETKRAPSHYDDPKQARRFRYERHGATAVVKKLTQREPCSALPKAIALKCYDEHSEASEVNRVFENASVAAAIYQQRGYFAHAFKNNGKAFLAMEWMSDVCLIDFLNDFTAHKDVDSANIILAFKGLVDQVNQFHKRFGKGIGDLKPENILVRQNGEQLSELIAIDIEGALGSSTTVTPGYMNPHDLNIYAQCVRGKKPYSGSIAADFRTLAIIFALVMNYSTLKYFSVSAYTLPPIITATGEKRACGTGFKFKPVNHAGTAHQRVVHAIYNTLVAGENPFISWPEPVFEMMLDHDIKQLQATLEAYSKRLGSIPDTTVREDNAVPTVPDAAIGLESATHCIEGIKRALTDLNKLAQSPELVEPSLLLAYSDVGRQIQLLSESLKFEFNTEKLFFKNEITLANSTHLVDENCIKYCDDYLDFMATKPMEFVSVHMQEVIAASQEKLEAEPTRTPKP